MRTSAWLLALLSLGACTRPETHPSPHPAGHWSYDGESGPAHWASLSPDFALCEQGREQSPIDLTRAMAARSPGYGIQYAPIRPTLRNNGHTIQVDYPAGSTLRVGDEWLELLQYHFHTPSEHRIDGRGFPLELHLVHRGADGLAVLGVLIREGRHNPDYAPLLDNLPASAGETRTLSIEHDARTLIPAALGSYRYAGSLTTPPCSEGVRWQVVTDPVELSREQIEQFRRIFHANARPVQPLRGRTLTVDRP